MNTIRRLVVAMLAIFTVITLCGCSTREPGDLNKNIDLYYKEFITKDGRHIQCAAITGGNGNSGLSCDWEHPITSKETK